MPASTLTQLLLATFLASVSLTISAQGVRLGSVAPGVDCKYTPAASSTCWLYRDITGYAEDSSGQKQSFSEGTGNLYQSSFFYSNSAQVSEQASGATGTASAYATIGLLRTFAAGSAHTGGEWSGPNTHARFNAKVGFIDHISVHSPSQAGQRGTVVGRVRVDGLLNASDAGWSKADARVQIDVPGRSYSRRVVADYGTYSESGNLPQFINFSIDLIFSPAGHGTYWQPIALYLNSYVTVTALHWYQNPGGLAQIRCDACTHYMRHDHILRDEKRRMECGHGRTNALSKAA